MTDKENVVSMKVRLISLLEVEKGIYNITFREIKAVPLDEVTFLDEGNTIIFGGNSVCFTLPVHGNCRGIRVRPTLAGCGESRCRSLLSRSDFA